METGRTSPEGSFLRFGTQTMNKIPMTADGYGRLEEELKQLKSIERPAIIRAIARRASTAISRRTPSITPRATAELHRGRVLELEDKISRAEIIDVSKLSAR
jgi:transcription elongation factor GreA